MYTHVHLGSDDVARSSAFMMRYSTHWAAREAGKMTAVTAGSGRRTTFSWLLVNHWTNNPLIQAMASRSGFRSRALSKATNGIRLDSQMEERQSKILQGLESTALKEAFTLPTFVILMATSFAPSSLWERSTSNECPTKSLPLWVESGHHRSIPRTFRDRRLFLPPIGLGQIS